MNEASIVAPLFCAGFLLHRTVDADKLTVKGLLGFDCQMNSACLSCEVRINSANDYS